MTDNACTLRMGTPDDAAIIARMVGELAEYERLGDINHATADTIREELASDSCMLEVVIAFVDGQPAGMATFFMTYSTFAAKRGIYLEDIYVKSDYRHQGIGSALLRRVAAIAHERDCGRIEWTTLLWNTPAIEFYESMNATPNDAWTSYRLIGDSLRNLASERAPAAEAADD